MQEEMTALEKNEMWDLVSLPLSKQAVRCRWVYSVKLNRDGSLARLKAQLVFKGYSQVYDWLPEHVFICSQHGFSPDTYLHGWNSLLASALAWYQKCVHHSILDEEVYMEQPPGFVAWKKSGKVHKLKSYMCWNSEKEPGLEPFASIVQEFDLSCSQKDHLIFIHQF